MDTRTEAAPPERTIERMQDVVDVVETLRGRIRHDVMGRDDVIELVLVALFGDGHVLLEDYPGSGKTTLAKALGNSIYDDIPDDDIPSFRRIQFTPDLLPSDVTGVMVFDTDTNSFHFRRGPAFAYVVLVDEINRTSPKVQAALLEALAEKQVTVDNVSHQLDQLFFVIATQNPLDSIGTYPLPVAQLDRFLFKLIMQHVDRESELEILESWGEPREPCRLPLVNRGDVIRARTYIRKNVKVASPVRECLVDLANALGEDDRVVDRVSTRSLVLAIPALQTLAAMRGRTFVSSEDISDLMCPMFQHRVALVSSVDDPADVIRDVAKGPLDKLSSRSLR